MSPNHDLTKKLKGIFYFLTSFKMQKYSLFWKCLPIFIAVKCDEWSTPILSRRRASWLFLFMLNKQSENYVISAFYKNLEGYHIFLWNIANREADENVLTSSMAERMYIKWKKWVVWFPLSPPTDEFFIRLSLKTLFNSFSTLLKC